MATVYTLTVGIAGVGVNETGDAVSYSFTGGSPGPAGADGAAGPNTVSGTTATAFNGILRGTGMAVDTVTIGSGLTFSAGTLSATGGGGGGDVYTSKTNVFSVFDLQASDGTGDGGHAPDIAITGGAGAYSTSFGGDGSNVTIQPGAAGTGDSDSGTDGVIELRDAQGTLVAQVHSNTFQVVGTFAASGVPTLSAAQTWPQTQSFRAPSSTSYAIVCMDEGGKYLHGSYADGNFNLWDYSGASSIANRRGQIRYHDGGGWIEFGRSDHTTHMVVTLNSTSVSFGVDNASALLTINGNGAGLVLSGGGGGGATIIDMGRRSSDNSTSVGAQVRLWPITGQSTPLLEFLAPGGASRRAAFWPDASWLPPSIADSAAANGTVYYSTTAGKLVYKDSGGAVNNLY